MHAYGYFMRFLNKFISIARIDALAQTHTHTHAGWHWLAQIYNNARVYVVNNNIFWTYGMLSAVIHPVRWSPDARIVIANILYILTLFFSNIHVKYLCQCVCNAVPCDYCSMPTRIKLTGLTGDDHSTLPGDRQ